MNNLTSAEGNRFKMEFETGALTPAEFSHRSHARLAYIYLCEHAREIAYLKMRRSLKRFLLRHGVEPSKYHETRTQAWVRVIHHFMCETPGATSAEALMDANTQMLDSRVMMTHCSNELLVSGHAKSVFVEPDIDPVPRHDSGRKHPGEA